MSNYYSIRTDYRTALNDKYSGVSPHIEFSMDFPANWETLRRLDVLETELENYNHDDDGKC